MDLFEKDCIAWNPDELKYCYEMLKPKDHILRKHRDNSTCIGKNTKNKKIKCKLQKHENTT